jgi:ketosteroid isomerase-like protein
MRKRFLVFLAALTVAAGARAQDSTAAARREIEAGYNQISAAFKREDADAMLALTTPDFQVKTPNGRTLNRAAALQNLQSNFDTIHAIRDDRYRIQKVALKGASAVVLVTERSAVAFMDSRGEFGAVGKTHEVVSTTDYRDTWVKQTDGGWRQRRSEIRDVRVTLDGRAYRPTTTRPRRQPAR